VRVYEVEAYPDWDAALQFDQFNAKLWFFLHDHAGRDNMFIAYELGRLHHSRYGSYKDRSPLLGPQGRDRAYRFAEQLLMPVDWLRYYGPGFRYNVPQLASLLLVEDHVMEARVEDLLRRGEL